MGIAKKIVTGTAIAGVSVAAVAGIAVYNASQYVRKLLYPPTLKKYTALAAIPFVLYAIKKPIETVDAINSTIRATGQTISGGINYVYNSRVAVLTRENQSLENKNKVLVKRIGDLSNKSDVIEDELAKKNLDELARDNWFALSINASSNYVSLLKSDGKSYAEIIRYPCTTGLNPAPKRYVGDNATPQGVFMAYLDSKPAWNEKFTDNFLRLKMPHNLGRGIFVVGSNDAKMNDAIANHTDATKGGIVLRESDFQDISNKIKNIQRVPVAIYFNAKDALPNYVSIF